MPHVCSSTFEWVTRTFFCPLLFIFIPEHAISFIDSDDMKFPPSEFDFLQYDHQNWSPGNRVSLVF